MATARSTRRSKPAIPPGHLLENGTTCRNDCTYCGDGFVQPWLEACDEPGDACADDCHVPVFVDPQGNDDTGDGTPEQPYATIQKAYDEAVEFTRIIVRPGTYNECLRAGYPDVLDRPIKIIAEDWIVNQDNTTTTISGEGLCDHELPLANRAPVVLLGSRASTLEGFTITGGGDSGVSARGSVTITHNVITENHGTSGGGHLLLFRRELLLGGRRRRDLAQSDRQQSRGTRRQSGRPRRRTRGRRGRRAVRPCFRP